MSEQDELLLKDITNLIQRYTDLCVPDSKGIANQILALIPDEEEAKKQEGERILKLYEDMGCVKEEDDRFRQALKGEK